MASRLDRLFVLLETGSTQATRRAAAQQLGEVQRLHPHELPLLLSRVHKCLRSPSWETRVAAGHAVEAILSQVPQWTPQFNNNIKQLKSEPIIKQETSDEIDSELVINIDEQEHGQDAENENNMDVDVDKSTPSSDLPAKARLKFDTFDLEQLFSSVSHLLMASEAKVFENNGTSNAQTSSLNKQDDPTSQRNLINKRLGLDIAEKMGIDTSDIVTNDDLAPSHIDEDSGENTPNGRKDDFKNFVNFFDPNLEEQMSSREINLAKRRARKQKTRELQALEAKNSIESSCSNGPNNKKLKREDSVYSECGELSAGSIYAVEEGQWPLSAWVDILVNDIFSPMWEVRHGAATALREVIKLHGNGGGREASLSTSDSNSSHKEWIEDLALRLVSVLALDRFGDFVSDQVVAPVRETCSQCLGTVVTLMESSAVTNLVEILIRLLSQSSWEARHGSLLGLKYIFVVRRDLIESLLPQAFPSVFACLSDKVDDVCAVAASSLIPVADLLVETLTPKAPLVVNVLWDSLADLDDLSSACNSIMGLLATLLTFPKARSHLRELDVLIPRLWPFLHHTSSSVRKSALLTLQKLTELDQMVTPLSVEPLQETLRHTYQRALLEHISDVQQLIPRVWSDLLKSSRLETLLQASCPLFGTWLCLAMQPPRVPFDAAYLVSKSMCLQGDKKSKSTASSVGGSEGLISQKVFMGGSGDGDPNIVATTRLNLAKMLGQLAQYVVHPLPPGISGEAPIEIFVRVLMVHLNSRSALQRTVTSFVISAWPPPTQDILKSEENNTLKVDLKSHPGLCKRLIDCLNESVYFDEIALGFTKLQSECRDFVATLKHYKVPLPSDIENATTLFALNQIEVLVGNGIVETIQKNLKKPKVADTLLDRRKSIWNLWNSTTTEFAALNVMTLAAIASAVTSIGSCLPIKLNPVVKPLMESIRREENQKFQKSAADHLCILMDLVQTREQCPNAKIIQNLTSFLCSENSELTPAIDDAEGILSLTTVSGMPETSSKKLTKQEEQAEYELTKWIVIQRRGATFALTSIVSFFGADLPAKVPKLWEVTFGVLESASVSSSTSIDKDLDGIKVIINAIQVLETVSPYIHKDLFPTLESQIRKMCTLLSHKIRAVRHMASRCLAVWAYLMSEKVMPIVSKEVVPLLDASENDVTRQGAIEAIWCIVDKMGLNLLPYIVLLVVPVLGRMSDQDESVRMLASLTFATLVRLMPLEGGVPDPPNLPLDLAQQKGEQREFLEQLLNPSKIPEYKVTVPINAELRPYQQAGINWLGFLNRFKLHGILCDDMGLGKTLQSICVLGSDHKEREDKYKDCKSPDSLPLPSIVICPPTLTGHWVYEVEKFISRDYLNPLHYHGPPLERNKLKPLVSSHNLVVASYDIVRNDIDFFSSIRWNYCILDEGHIIKNGKTKISKAIKQLKSNHRLILSGTPIQNNVLELWSLFDFLMPGFLGTEKQFSARFGRPILMARDPKSSPKDQEAGALAMEALHRQALPFLLRRLKEDVLQDLPPKITQDYYCELSAIQEQLYDDFARTKAHQSLRDTFSANDDPSKHSHIFQALQYLRKVCNHPKLVLTNQHPKYPSVMKMLKQNKSTLDDINHSAKLPALKQLLLDCGIGVMDNSSHEDLSVVSQHRALIFCQLKVMLDILEHDLFKVHMPSITYLRLDGSVPAGQRHSLVTRFNNDPSIDVLLLTTQVGGLGLNLTGADTVIFVEHDWNPMRDLQAMDRAHRIGQKKVVNVYRLITRGTLEEKIMGLQKFKLMTANTVISQENSCIETMATDQILDLFVLEDGKDGSNKSKNEDVGGIVGAYKNVLENLPELWEDKLYEEEYDLSSFIKNLAK